MITASLHDLYRGANNTLRSPWACILFLFTCCLTGCATPHIDIDTPPSVNMPIAWSGSTLDTKAELPDIDWWRKFGSGELTNLVQEGRRNNYQIGAAISRVREAQLQAQIADATLLPELDVVAGANRQLPTVAGNSTTSATGVLEVSYEVD